MTQSDKDKSDGSAPASEQPQPKSGAQKAKDDRQARLSQALRDNLRRRKAQSRSRKQSQASDDDNS